LFVNDKLIAVFWILFYTACQNNAPNIAAADKEFDK
jgi:hypothetical protein